MPGSRLQEIKRYTGFTADDARRLRKAGPAFEPHLYRIADHFYERLTAFPGTRNVFEGPEQIERLHHTFHEWLRGLFTGRYDQRYAERISRIGEVHVRVGLPQRYMITAMEVVWQDFQEIAREIDLPDKDDCLTALHRLLMLNLTLMLERYQHDYARQLRELERQALADKLTEAEHLARIGQLAASLAHEIKNPLAGISGAIQIIAEALGPDSPYREVISEILAQIDRLDRAVRDLLIYARPIPPHMVQGSLVQEVQRLLTVMENEPSLEGIRVVVTGDDHETVWYDPQQMQQVLSNLILNAAQASRPGQTIRISVTHRPDVVRLVVADEGEGIPPDLLPRVCEPFFTTKARGTGLGLSICSKIVQAHEGRLRLESAPGRGTRAVVELPRAPRTTQRTPESDAHQGPHHRG